MARQGIIQKTKGKSVVTPAGSAMWVKVVEPDYKFNPKGTYEAQIVCDPKEPAVKAYVESLQKMLDAALAEAREALKPPKDKTVVARDVVSPEYDREGNETGNIVIKTKTYAVDFDGNPTKVEVYDNKGRKEDNWNTLIGNGSTIKMQAWVSAYHMANGNTVGLSSKLKKIQVINLEKYESDDGFGDESGEAAFDSDVDVEFKSTATDF